MKKTRSDLFVFEGVISLNSKAVGFVPHPNKKDKDVRIEKEHLNTALHRDRVLVTITGTNRGVYQGKVTEVRARAKEVFAGIPRKENGYMYIDADDRKMYTPICIPSYPHNLSLRDKVLVRITHWNEGLPLGEITKVIGEVGDNTTEMHAIVFEKGFDTDFPIDVTREAEDIPREIPLSEMSQRKDMRHVPTCTIDPIDAKDFDDALSIEKKGAYYEVGVHIADVSHYVRPRTALDKEAQERAFSVYLVDRTIPMLPHRLSNDLCSLNPNEDKLAFSAVFTMKENGAVVSSWFGKTVIRSKKRFTYEEAQEVLETKTGIMVEELTTLNTIAKNLQKEKFKHGAIDFEQSEVKFKLDDKGFPIGVLIKERKDSHKLVEEFMLLANKEVARFISDIEHKNNIAQSPLLFRIHDEPNKEKIRDLSAFVRALGYTLPHKEGKVSAKDLQTLMKQVEGKAEETMIKTATIRSMAKAIYSTKNIGHFGLAFDYYAHFTSPIRRYPDLLVHRILELYLDKRQVPQRDLAFYEECALRSTDREIAAAEAERESIKYKQVEYMTQFKGSVREGTVSGVTEWGMYVEDKETKAEGLVRLSDMKDDYYALDKKRYAIVGQKKNKIYSIGDSVSFKITATDVERRIIDCTLA